MDTVIINDVGPRDGLQNDPTVVSVEDRVALINALVEAGLPAVEAVSFVSPKAVPKMAGADRVAAALDHTLADFSALVPNHKGYELARSAGMPSVAVVLSATDAMNDKNINMNLDTTVGICSEIMGRATEDRIRPRAYISVAVECPFEGIVPESRIEDLAATMFGAGAEEVIIADTIGAANPAQVKSLFSRLVAAFGAEKLSAHFHDTRALALANAWQALECGIRKFDSSIGGLGGCPFAPGAAGNLATEDLASMLEQAGFHTGIDVGRLLQVVELARALVAHDLGGRSLAWQLGRSRTLDTTAEAS